MKRSVIILLILFLPVISAVTIDMKEEFSQGETLMAKVSGNFYESITKEDIFFYERYVRQPMSPFITKINNDFYIYAQSDKPENNYSMVIKNVKHISKGIVVEEDFTKYFLITNSTADFSITPGFVSTNENFFIEVENFKDAEMTLEVVASSVNLETKEPINFGPGTKKIYFSIENTNSTFEVIKLSTANTEYEIPVYVFGEGTTNVEITDETICENIGTCKTSCDEDSQDLGKIDCGFFSTCCQEKISEQKSFNFEKSKLKIVMPTNSRTIREIYLYNTGEETLEDISIEISGELKNYISLLTDEIDELKSGENVKIEIEFYSFDKAVEVQGTLTAKEGTSTSSEIFLNIIPDYIPLDEYEYTPSQMTQTCEELNEKICPEDTSCDTDYTLAKDALCCPGECVGEEPSSSGKIIGWAIVGIVVVFLIWFFKTKYKGAKKPASLLDVAKWKK